MTRLYRYIDSVTGELKTTENTISTISGNYFVEYFTLTASHISDKKITLTNTPTDTTTVSVDVSQGIPQDYGTDFTVSGDELSWNGMGLETLIEENDKIKVSYVI